MNQPSRVQQAQTNQKIVYITRPQTPGNTIQQSQQNPTNQQNTVVKFVSNANTQHTQKVVSAQQKLVVVGMPSSSPSQTSTLGQNTFMTSVQGSITSPQIVQGNQTPMSMAQKTAYMQQQQQKLKQDMSGVNDDLF